MRFHLHRPARALPRRRLMATAIASLIALMAVGSAMASTPVTNGYRDHSYGGGAFRPSSDKPQSKLWFTDGSWFAGMFHYTTVNPPKSENRIWRLDKATHSWNILPTVVDTRDTSRADYLWHETSNTLWVASVSPQNTAAGFPVAIDDAVKVFKYTYDDTTNAYTQIGTFVEIPGTETVAGVFGGGAATVTIDRDSSGRLWAAWPKLADVMYSYSSDGGTTWSTAAKVPIQTNPIRAGNEISNDSVSVVAFGARVGIAWSDHDAVPAATDDGFYFAHIASGGDPTVLGNWTLEELPTLVVGNEMADNHVNIKAASDGTLYMVGKTGKDTALCATNKNLPLVELFRRTAAGVWSAHLVGTVGDCNTRPQVVISEELDVAYVLMTSPNGGGAIYMKSAPLTGPEALKFRGPADQVVQPGTPFIRSATETLIDDASTSKHPVTQASGLVAIANNLLKAGTPNAKFFLHGEMSIAASDAIDPAGTITIAAGALFTGTAAVSVAVPATDAGSGVSLVRLSNTSAVSGDGTLTAGTSFNYTTPVPWTLSAGAGVKTVWAQWRDASGNWSAPVSDSITMDTTAPTGTVAINNGAALTPTASVTLNLTANDGAGSGVASVLVSNTTDFTGATPIPFAASVPWTLSTGNGTKTVYVKFVDALGNTSAAPITDTIVYDTVAPAAGTVSIAGGAASTTSRNVTVGLSGVAGDAVAARASNVASMAGAIAVSPTGSFAWTLAAGSGTRTVYVQWRDAAGNWSAAASDSIVLNSPTPFTDINGNAFEADIVWLYESGITGGCTPTKYCPLDNVTRGQMAAFLVRALDLPATATDFFTDDESSTFENSINRLAAAGITGGCTPTKFCPLDNVTRGQMAAFLVRALDLPATATDYFTDDETSTFENSINRLRAAGITGGCTPTKFCPLANVTRGQMAAFLHRALGPTAASVPASIKNDQE